MIAEFEGEGTVGPLPEPGGPAWLVLVFIEDGDDPGLGMEVTWTSVRFTLYLNDGAAKVARRLTSDEGGVGDAAFGSEDMGVLPVPRHNAQRRRLCTAPLRGVSSQWITECVGATVVHFRRVTPDASSGSRGHARACHS